MQHPIKAIQYPNQNEATKRSRRLLYRGSGILIGLIAIIFSMPYLLTTLSWLYLGVAKPNELGDTLGGIMGPMIGIIAAALTFYAFWAQFDANLNQQVQMGIQDKRATLDAFENKFYTMLSIHRDNVNGIDLNETKGRKVFVLLMDELRFCYWVIKKFYDESPSIASPLCQVSDDEIFQVAYLSFFFGIGEKSTPLVMDLVGSRLQAFVENAHEHITNSFSQSDKCGAKYSVNIPNTIIKWEKTHQLGTGHLRRLSHYIRHLYQTVKFVDDQSKELLSDSEKYDYITNLRAQLSTFEQLLLYYNALSVLGQPWMIPGEGQSENYIVKYCLVKSMPINSADFYVVPNKILPENNKLNKPMFEWLEIRKRMQNVSTAN